ncbi:MAG: hypothetical protein NVSMB54_31040 [Ktedonobacteraceae bacterium]
MGKHNKLSYNTVVSRQNRRETERKEEKNTFMYNCTGGVGVRSTYALRFHAFTFTMLTDVLLLQLGHHHKEGIGRHDISHRL